MEELLPKLLSMLQVPTIVVTISVIVLRLIAVLPLTFVTAHEIEKKIYTKEQRLLYQIIHYLFKMIIVTIFMLPFGDFFANNPNWYRSLVALFAFICLNIFFAVLYWMDELQKKITDIKMKSIRFLFLMATGIYSLGLIVLPPYFTGPIVRMLYSENPETMSINYYIILASIFFFCSIFIVLMLKPLNKILAFKTEKVVSIEIEKEGKKEKWYLLHPVKADRYLIGDNYNPGLCKRNMIITKEQLIEKEFFIENVEYLKKDSSISKKSEKPLPLHH
ncbi:hypothetical protein [Brevibacillus sp. SIMBA_040]|uniref:hypothetical protein n=1 Tax=unclassified Brevibacillus TaxID=2684853 RepID=UPI00397B2DFF